MWYIESLSQFPLSLKLFVSIEKEEMLMCIVEQMWEKILQTCESKHNS